MFDPVDDEAAPAAADLGCKDKLDGIGQLARLLDRKPDTLRVWIRRGWLPDAAHRGPGGSFGQRRYWPAAEVELIVSAAHDAGIIANHGHDVDLTETEFSARVRSGLERLRGAK